jgi:transcriptional regulator with XRE-family HTH domain
VAQVLFRELLSRYMERSGLTQGQLERLTNASKGWTSHILSGGKSAPTRDVTLTAWAKALELTPEETEEFIETALLEHTPPWIADRYREMKNEMTSRTVRRKKP